ncbi:MAG: hypothetical protein IJ875_06655 [Solobacterium sp.]|nr:hypothetical protein [Solobacterium sp.]
MIIISLIANIFDRVFIDYYWVGKTNAWNIPGTEDLKPYIPTHTLIKKWIGTLIVHPVNYPRLKHLGFPARSFQELNYYSGLPNDTKGQNNSHI